MSETMVGSAGLTVSALARRGWCWRRHGALLGESGVLQVGAYCSTIAWPLCLRHEHRSLRLGFPPHELTAAIDLALFDARSQASLPVLNRLCRQTYAPGWAMRPVSPGPDADGFETIFWPSLLIFWGDLSVPMCWHADRSSDRPRCSPAWSRVPSCKSRRDSERLPTWQGPETLQWPIGRWRARR